MKATISALIRVANAARCPIATFAAHFARVKARRWTLFVAAATTDVPKLYPGFPRLFQRSKTVSRLGKFNTEGTGIMFATALQAGK